MIFKYTSRLIKSTKNRFIAIVAIVFIGVSFMMGIRSNYTIMKNSVEDYYDKMNLYDVQIYSNYGFDDSNVKAIKNLDFVEDVYASKTRDVYAQSKDGYNYVSRVLELDQEINKIELIEGRTPEKENECLILSGYLVESSGTNIGDKLTLSLDDEDVSESFKNKEYTIVGRAKSSEYISKTFTTSLLDNAELEIVLFIPNSNFIFDYYTTLFVTYDGARQLNSFEKEYEDYIDSRLNELEDLSITQSQSIKNKLSEEITSQINDGKKELQENIDKYEVEFAQAKEKLDDAARQLDDAKKEIEDGELELISAKQELLDGEDELEKAKKELINGEAELEKAKKELAEGEKELNEAIAQIESYGITLDEALELFDRIYSVYDYQINRRDSYISQIDELTIQKQEADNITKDSGFQNAEEVLEAMSLIEDVTSEEYLRLQEIYNAFNTSSKCKQQIEHLNNRLTLVKAEIYAFEYAVSLIFPESSIEEIRNNIQELKDGIAKIEQGKKEIAKGQKELEEGWEEFEAGKQELEEGKVEYKKGLKEYEDGLKEYEVGLKKYQKEIQDAKDDIEDAETYIKDLEKGEWIILARYDTNYSFYMYKSTCEQMKSIGTIIPLLFFIVAALVCATTMTRLLDEQRGQIGIYSAIGFRKSEIIWIYLLYVIIASLSASIVAVFVGVVSFPLIIYSTWRLMYDLPAIKLQMPLNDLLLSISSFTLLMMFVTFIVIRKTLKECSAQLLRPKSPKTAKKILLEKITWLWNKISFTSKITVRNLFRYKGRFIMTVIGVAGCTSLLLMGWCIKDSIGSLITIQMSEIYKYNYQVDLDNDRHIDQILESISNDPNNTIYVPYSSYSSNVVSSNGDESTLSVNAITSEGMLKVFNHKDLSTGKQFVLSDDGVAVTEKFAKVHNIKVGDYLTIESYEGTKAKVKVNSIVENYIAHFIYMSEECYKKVFNEPVEYTSISIRNDGDTTNLLNLPDEFRDVATVYDVYSNMSSFSDMIGALDFIIITIIINAGTLAFVVLINLTNVNISERIREIATLKVLGFKDKEVDAYINKEVILMSIFGIILGLPLGALEGRFILTVIDVDICMFPYVVKPMSYVYASVITIIFTLIVLLLTRKQLRKIQMVESLKSIE